MRDEVNGSPRRGTRRDHGDRPVQCAQHGGGGREGPLEEYYLALGDSVAYGYQASRD